MTVLIYDMDGMMVVNVLEYQHEAARSRELEVELAAARKAVEAARLMPGVNPVQVWQNGANFPTSGVVIGVEEWINLVNAIQVYDTVCGRSKC